MVKLYTNRSNPAALKLIIANNFSSAKVKLDITIVNLDGRTISEPKFLPTLEINNVQSIFMPNAGASYLFPASESNFFPVNELLEWEATILSPCLAYTLGNSAKNEKIRNNLLIALRKLNTVLENKKNLVGDSVTVADVAIWSCLYPLVKCDKLSKDYLSDLPNINGWFLRLENEVQFKDAVAEFKIEIGQTAYTALLAGARYLAPPLLASDAPIKEKESPQHHIEAVTSEELLAAKKAWKKNITQLPALKDQKNIVVPTPGEKNILITSALPYVNNVPHLGNIIGCVLSADVFARFSRLCNYNTLYICGTDEYGTATETKALEEGLSCKAICDKYFSIHDNIYKWFNISFNYFGRTSTPQQTEICQDMFLQLNSNGFMFTQCVEQLHCEKCDRYLADRFVEGGCPNIGCNYQDARGDQCDGCGKLVNAVELKNPRCKICGQTPKLKTSNQFFIDLPKLEPLLHHWIKISSPGWSNNAQVIARSWIKEGLKPRCITRDLKWGVPVPLDGFRDKVFYVWFDAPIGYLSISKAYTKDFLKWWIPERGTEVALYQFMAKDNVPFHSVLFPCMLLGANRGYTTVSHIMATEYLNYESGKFSKSRGVGVFGTDAQDTGIPSDVWRFYLLYIRPESQDSSFSWDDLATKNNSELLNNLGNFINRALVFAKNNFNRTVPEIKPTEEDYTLLALCTRELKGYVAALEKAKLRDGIRHILSISRHGNQYMQANQPWVLLKGSDDEKIRAGAVIGICCNLACLLATLLQPYMPDTSASLHKQLNSSDILITPSNLEIVTYLPAGHKLGEPFPLFAKIELTRVEELKKKFAGKQEEKENGKVDVKVIEAEVAKQAEKVRALKAKTTDKLVWKPEIDILLSLKKKLEAAQKNGPVVNGGQSPVVKNGVSPDEIKKLEEEVAKQGLIVRKLKEGGSDKSIWQPEVQKLLSLKNQLQLAAGESPSPQKNKKGKK
ncbi:methionine--tRNA ligase, cytoplasmic [Anoplophora glabripennis]|uniref:methionine--tRNA ligase, cytoplasmic n=1 Tax=Anoplophora glabripennis TaxID=217634 RepID=UPI000873CE01|nr:methionine--tRNA ligase, cytoplasmic [Anoplophora glabripennis]